MFIMAIFVPVDSFSTMGRGNQDGAHEGRVTLNLLSSFVV
jgi:hypothetical protein